MFVYKVTENNSCSQFFPEFTQTQKRYPTFLFKSIILTWKLLASIQISFCEINSSRTYYFPNIYPISVTATLSIFVLISSLSCVHLNSDKTLMLLADFFKPSIWLHFGKWNCSILFAETSFFRELPQHTHACRTIDFTKECIFTKC